MQDDNDIDATMLDIDDGDYNDDDDETRVAKKAKTRAPAKKRTNKPNPKKSLYTPALCFCRAEPKKAGSGDDDDGGGGGGGDDTPTAEPVVKRRRNGNGSASAGGAGAVTRVQLSTETTFDPRAADVHLTAVLDGDTPDRRRWWVFFTRPSSATALEPDRKVLPEKMFFRLYTSPMWVTSYDWHTTRSFTTITRVDWGKYVKRDVAQYALVDGALVTEHFGNYALDSMFACSTSRFTVNSLSSVLGDARRIQDATAAAAAAANTDDDDDDAEAADDDLAVADNADDEDDDDADDAGDDDDDDAGDDDDDYGGDDDDYGGGDDDDDYGGDDEDF